MLNELVVENLGIIERAELTLEGGCSVLTGETGAGKTLVVAALDLLLGGRADRALVRTGAAEARVEARGTFPPDDPAVATLVDEGLIDGRPPSTTSVEVVLSRVVASDGRTRARVNGRMTTVATLARLGAHVAEINGQHEHARFTDPATQLELLDLFGGPACQRAADEVRSAVAAAAVAARNAAAVDEDPRARARAVESLRHEIAEIEGAGVRPGELEELTAEAGRLEHAEAIAAAVGGAVENLRADGGVEELLAATARALEPAGTHDPTLAALARRVDEAALELGDVAHELAARVPAPDPTALTAVRDRLDVLARLRRRYGNDEQAILAYRDEAATRLRRLEDADRERSRWEGERDAHLERAREHAATLSTARARAARRLEQAVGAVLADLAMADARFVVRTDPCELGARGAEEVTFLLAANRGEDPKPMAKVASGGELSRLALALRLVTSARGAGTMVFDEVDTGVGGEAAQAVGRCLAQVADRSGAQVLVVTHLPQVAAFADVHLKVGKRTTGGRVTAFVRRVEGEERLEELSRMLAGLPDSDTARSHARELLELAGAR